MIENDFQEYIIGLDIGTGSSKAVAITSAGTIIADSQFFYPTKNNTSGYAGQDPEIIWMAFTNCIKKIISILQRPPISISLSSAMHSLLAVDNNHKPITDLIIWADTRSEKIAERIRALPEAETLYQSTGTPIHSMSPLCKIIWLKENEPFTFKSVFKFISIKEFIWYKLFNVYEIDQSIASATGLFDIQTSVWNHISLQLAEINAVQLSEIVSTNFIRKNLNSSIATLLNIHADTLFCIGASDGCLANVGSYAIESGTAALTIGTSGAVRVSSDQPIFNFEAMTFDYVLDEKTFICGGPVNNGGNVMPWLFQTFMNNDNPSEKDYTDLFKIIEAVPAGSKGLIFLPYLYGERSPIWDERSSALFFGIKSYHVNAYFLRAALEGICYSLNQILEIVESSTQSISQLNVSGGFIHSKTWMQILANVTGKKICVVETEDASAIGAALLNMKAINIIKDYSSLKPLNNIIIEPDLNDHAVHEKYFSIFENLYQSLKQSMHEVDELNI
ncbi:MAG: gluconokinase [Bacteroidota bacterium]|nr:gluconokinase [Bacteroidota bacterium]